MIYLDTCILIYAVEGRSRLGDRARKALASVSDGFAISPLVIHEALVVPLRRADTALIGQFATMFERCTVLDLDLATYVHAAELRAASPGLKTPDALHLAAAQLAGCSALWTNDSRLGATSGGLAVDVIGGDAPRRWGNRDSQHSWG